MRGVIEFGVVIVVIVIVGIVGWRWCCFCRYGFG